MKPIIAPPKSRSVMLPQPAQSDIAEALAACRGAFLGIALFSGMNNVLMLTGSFFMLEVYDRVLPSRSVPTLAALAILATVLYVFQGTLDLIRSRILGRIGRSLDERLGRRVYEAVIRFPLRAKSYGDGLQPVRDLDQVRMFLSSGGPSALFDLPWMPVYLGICFVFHVWIGVTALAGAVLLIAITVATEFLTRAPTKAAAGFAATRNALAAAGRRNAEVLQAMGMGGRMAALWGEANAKYLAASERASDVGGGLSAVSRVLRMILGSAVLGVGAYLVIHQEATGGIIIASSILTTRALAPVDLAISNWKGFMAARQGWQRLRDFLKLHLLERRQKHVDLPRPQQSLTIETLSVAPPGEAKLVVQDMSFTLKAGQAVGIIGPSAAGKSSLARAIVGVWQPARGKVRLDGAPLEQWTAERLGRHIGYLPQDIELFEGAVAQNIARFDPNANAEDVLAAARAAGVHELIIRLPNGYETRIGEGGAALSAGQRQRVALARALYGNPFLVVLDEPNSNLDAEGEEALTRAIMQVRARGGIVIVIAHRPSALASVDHVLIMADGRAQAFGGKEEVLSKALRPAGTPLPMPLKVVADAPGTAR
jgi:ATP-binding cassette subfamily C protein